MAAKPQTKPEQSVIPAGTLPWHGDSWSQFSESVAARRVAHGILLSGQRGTGKRHFANQAAALLLCSSVVSPGTPGAQACGECKQCRLLAAESHPDLSIMAPVDSRVIKIEQIRRLTEFVVRSPQVGQRKVAVIDTADRLNLNAANALLKTLEEPVDNVVLLLLHNAGEPILPTIRSRCQAQRLPLPSPGMALAWMASVTPDNSEEVLRSALDRARGAPLAALASISQGLLEAGDECLESLRQFLKGDRQLAEATLPFTRLGLEASLDLLAQWAVVAMKIALGHHDSDTGPGHEMLGFLARNNPAPGFTGILDQVTAARHHQVYNVNPELVINDILLSWKALMPQRRRAAAARMN